MREQGDTAARLIAAAERLFVDEGEAATSLRAVARAANASAAAVHYHFGGRDELLRAVYHRQLAAVAERRLRRLDELGAAGAPVALADLVAAVVRPDLELLAKLRRHKVEVARFLGRSRTSPVMATTVRAQAERLAARVLPLLRPSLVGIGDAELRLRLDLIDACVAGLFAGAPDPGETGPLGSDDVDEQVRRLVAYCAGGLSAPPVAREPRPAPGGKRKKRGGR